MLLVELNIINDEDYAASIAVISYINTEIVHFTVWLFSNHDRCEIVFSGSCDEV